MNPSLHHKSPTPLPLHTLLSSCIHCAMSQEGTNLPQEVEGIHDQATAPHGNISAGVGLATTTVMLASSNSSSISKLSSAVNNVGSSERASLVVLSAGEDNNAMSFKIAIPAVLHAGGDNNAVSKITSPPVLLASKENKSDLTVLVAGEKGNGAAGSMLARSSMLHDYYDNQVGSHAGVDNNNARSKLASPAVLHAGKDNGGSKIAGLAVPHAIVDNTTGFKLNSPASLHAGEHNNAGSKLPNPIGLNASKDMDNNTRRPKFASPMLFAGKDNKARTKLAIQAVSHVGGSAGSSRLTRSAVLHAAKYNGSKLAIQVVPRPHAGKDNNAGSSKAARATTLDAIVESNAKEGKNNVAGEQRGHEPDMGSGRGKGNATVVEDADHDLHIFTERERRKKMKNMFSTLHALLPQLPHKADKATIVGEAVTYIKSLEGTLHKLERLKLERKRALAAQQQLVVATGTGSSRASSSRHPAPAAPPAAVASSSREATLADMVHGWEAQEAAVVASNKALATAVAGAGGSSSSGAAAELPRGSVPFPAPAAGFQTWSGQNVVVSVANNNAYINLHCPRQPSTLTKALFVLERHRIEVLTTTISAQDGFRLYGIHARANPASVSPTRFPENLCAEDRFKLAVSEMIRLINT